MDRSYDFGPADAFAEGDARSQGPVTVFRHQGRLHAVASRCPHMGYPMSKGTLRDGVVTCAWHGWEFDLDNGGCYRGACDDLPIHPIEIVDGTIRVRAVGEAEDPATHERRLRESLLGGDVYLEAKALAGLLVSAVEPPAIAATVLRHGFAHAVAAHRSLQASVEARAVLDATRLAALMEPGERVAVLLQGVRTVGGPVGQRPAVAPLPGPLTSGRLHERLAAAVAESSDLGVERVLLSLPAAGVADPAIDAAVLALAAGPAFLEQPEALAAVVTAGEVATCVGADGRDIAAALVAWVLGAPRSEPVAEARPALQWLQGQAAHIAALDPPERGRAPAEADVAAIGEAVDGSAALASVVAWFADGAGWADVLDGFAVFFARRLARQVPGSGGLVPAALDGLRWTRAAMAAARRGNGQTRVRTGLLLAWHLFATRWLQPGRPWDGDAGVVATWDAYAAAVADGDASTARSSGVALLTQAGCADAAIARWLAPLLHDDSGPALLDALVAVVERCRAGGEWQPGVAGVVNAVLDGRMRQDVRAAARFGRSIQGG